MSRALSVIAAEIRRDWKKVNYAAEPYLFAMQQLTHITDDYYGTSAKEVVLYFLSNASSWRGDVARRVKLELNKMVDEV